MKSQQASHGSVEKFSERPGLGASKLAPSQWRKYTGLHILAVVQVVYFVAAASLHGYAPLGVQNQKQWYNVTSLASIGGYISTPVTVTVNPYIGLTELALVLAGAAFTPCMRKDDAIFTRYETISTLSQNGSCCGACVVTNNMTRVKSCASTDRRRCLSLYSTPKEGYLPGKLCSSTRIHDRMAVSHTLSACCIGLLGHCHLTTIGECMQTFQGKWFAERTCNDVNCLGETCGPGFQLPTDPEHRYRPLSAHQYYRWFFSSFLHRGVVEIFILINLQYWLGRHIELESGPICTMTVFFISGIGGQMVASTLQPYHVHTGSRCAVWGYSAFFLLTFLREFDLSSAPMMKWVNHICFFSAMLCLDALLVTSTLANMAAFFFGAWTLLLMQRRPWFRVTGNKVLWKTKEFWLRMHGLSCIVASVAVVAACFANQVSFPTLLSDYSPEYCGRGVKTLNNPAAVLLYDEHEYDFFVYHTNGTSDMKYFSCQ